MADPFVAEIRMFAFNFAPRGWAMCNGQLMPLSQNTALFSLLGTTYGGDGKSTFALPDLQDATPVAAGWSNGGEIYPGEQGGAAQVQLQLTELAGHVHQLQHGGAGSSATPGLSSVLGSSGAAQIYTQSASAPLPQMPLRSSGAGQPHNNRQPYLTLNFCIALQGVFPPRP
jgi:microcystin-dependent protein